MDRRIKHRLIRDVTLLIAGERDPFGDVTEATETEVKAYRHGKVEKVTNFEGEVVESHRQFIIDGVWEFKAGDRLKEGKKTSDNQKLPIQAFAAYDGLKAGTGTTVVYL